MTMGRNYFTEWLLGLYVASCYQKATLCQYSGSHDPKGTLFWSGQIIGLTSTCYNQYIKITIRPNMTHMGMPGGGGAQDGTHKKSEKCSKVVINLGKNLNAV